MQATIWVVHNLNYCTHAQIASLKAMCIVAAGCATVAEVRKRGDDFWGEFEFYLSDLVVGCVLDCVLVGLLAPSAVIGAKPKTKPSGKHSACLHERRCQLAIV